MAQLCKPGDLSSNPQNPYGAKAGSASLQSCAPTARWEADTGGPQKFMG